MLLVIIENVQVDFEIERKFSMIIEKVQVDFEIERMLTVKIGNLCSKKA